MLSVDKTKSVVSKAERRIVIEDDIKIGDSTTEIVQNIKFLAYKFHADYTS